jgi:hypothetical protein
MAYGEVCAPIDSNSKDKRMQEDNVDEPNAVAEGLRGWRGSALIDEARERFEKQEHGRSRLGYGAVAQFAALDGELQLIPRLAADIREQLATLTDDWILVFRNCDHDQLAFVTLDSLLTSIIRRRTGLKAWIGLGRAAHGEAWAAGPKNNQRSRRGEGVSRQIEQGIDREKSCPLSVHLSA